MDEYIALGVQIGSILLGLISAVWAVIYKSIKDKNIEKYKKELEDKQNKSIRYLDIIIESYKELCALIGPLVESMQLIYDVNELLKEKVYLDNDKLDETLMLCKATKSKVMALAPFISKSVYDKSVELISTILLICLDATTFSGKEVTKGSKTLTKITHITSKDASILVQGIVDKWQIIIKLISNEIKPQE